VDYDQELIDTYIEESREHLASIEEDLVELERRGAERDDELVNKIFRAAHSIKGGAGFFEFKVIKELAHKLENALDLVRSGKIVPNPEIVTILLRGFDRLSELIDASDSSDSADVSDELVSLVGLTSEYSPDAFAQRRTEKFAAPGSNRELEADAGEIERALARGLSIFMLRFDLVHDIHRHGKNPLDVIRALLTNGEILDCAVDFLAVGTLDDDSSGDDVPFLVLYATSLGMREISEKNEIPRDGIVLHRLAAATVAAVAVADSGAVPRTAGEPSREAVDSRQRAPEADAVTVQAGPAAVENETVRVSVNVLDDLMNLSGELVLVRNELADATRRADAHAIQTAGQRMSAVTTGIQDAVMRSRMQPASNLFARFQRTVRDLARDLGKEIDLKISGKETELDRSLIETLSDPLTHLVRNACDHGIETNEVRAKGGKTRNGVISLSAKHEAGQVVILVEDDGKGIDAEKVAAKAVSMGLISAEKAALMSVKEKLFLITVPGLSTSSSVSDLSGRGVGMDVVKSNVDRLGGRIDIDSTPGKGTTVRITLPLTLSIIPALIAGIGEERFALPQAAAAELVQIRPGDVHRRIERIRDRPVLVLRGEVLPLVRLSDAIGMPRSFENPEAGTVVPDRRERLEDRRGGRNEEKGDRSQEDRRFHSASDYRIVVIRASGFNYGVVVDRLYDTTEIVVKPLGRHLKGLKEYSGATILGDGAVALIIDPAGLALKAGLVSTGEERIVIDEAGMDSDNAQGWLIFRNGISEQCAMPIEAVERVVRIVADDLDAIGDDLYLRVGKESLPVFPVSAFTGLSRLEGDTAEACVLCHAAGRRFGFLAVPPVDSVAAVATIDDRSMRKAGVSGTTVIHGRTTVVIDPVGAAAALKPEWFSRKGERGPSADRESPSSRAPEAAGPSGDAPLVLVAEDSDFFRKVVGDFLTETGYRVIEARDGQEALESVRSLDGDLDLVLTDVEMSRMDGCSLTLKLAEQYPALPVVALTSLASEADEKRLRDAGVRDYLVKLDKDALLDSVVSILETTGRDRTEKEKE